MDFYFQISSLVRNRGGILHMDGARLFNAAVRLGVPAESIVKHVDSVTFCFSKGLGCPVGSILVGSKSFIQRLLLYFSNKRTRGLVSSNRTC